MRGPKFVRRALTLSRGIIARTIPVYASKYEDENIFVADRPVSLTSSTIDNVNLRLRQDTGKVTMSSYLMRVDRTVRRAGMRRLHRLQHCVTGGPSILISVRRRTLTGDDDT